MDQSLLLFILTDFVPVLTPFTYGNNTLFRQKQLDFPHSQMKLVKTWEHIIRIISTWEYRTSQLFGHIDTLTMYILWQIEAQNTCLSEFIR